MRVERYVAALFATTLGLIGGLWLALAPWLLGLVQPGSAWTGPAVVDVATGAGLVATAVVACVLYWRSLGAELARAAAAAAGNGRLPRRRTRRRPAEEVGMPARPPLPPSSPRPQPSPAAGAAAGGEQALDVLLPIATALLSDMVQRHGTERPPAGPAGGGRGEGTG